MRLFAALLCTSFAIALMGAGTTTTATLPTIVIYPMQSPAGLDPGGGIGFSQVLGNALKELGGVNVVMGDSATTPADYLRTAKADGGDFYMMGSVAPPIKDAMAVIEQVVSARTGIVAWSGTAYVSSQADIVAQAATVKLAVSTYQTRGFMAILNPTPTPARTAAPTVKQRNAAAVNAAASAPKSTDAPPLRLPNEAYGFSSKPTAPPKVYASANKPSRFVVLTFVGKDVPPDVREYTVNSLVKALQRHGQSAAEGNPDTTGHRLPSVDLCTSTGASYLVFGSITGSSVKGDEFSNWHARSNASLSLAAYDCAAQKFVRNAKEVQATSGVWTDAVDRAANSAVTNYLLKVTAVATST